MSDLEDAYRAGWLRGNVVVGCEPDWVDEDWVAYRAAPHLEAERDAAAESCRLMQDRVERLVEANLGLQARLDDDEWRKVYEIEKANAERLFKSNLGLRETLKSIASDTNYWDATNRARAALGKEGE